MPLTLREVRALLARRAAGEALDSTELSALTRSARVLKRRLERLHALDPGAFGDVALSAELDELASPPVLSGSG